LEKYNNHPKCKKKGFLLPVLSNQKMNAYLKEIADVSGLVFNYKFTSGKHCFILTKDNTIGLK